MLKIIPPPTNRYVAHHCVPDKIDLWNRTLGKFSEVIYFEYFEDDVINFKFFYYLGVVFILEGSFISEYSSSEVSNFFNCYVQLDELWVWLDNEITFKTIRCLSPEDSDIMGIWKMDYRVDLSQELDSPLLENYYEFQVSTVIVRSIPYKYIKIIYLDVSDENNKTYWITLCLLKYQRQLNQPSEE